MPYANNQGIQIYYEVEGDGPPLVLVWGFSMSLEEWRELGYAEVLNKDNQLILVDVRGHGKSDKLYDPKDYGLTAITSDVVAVLDDLNIDKANYIGYSLGGRVGFGMAKYAPTRLNALIIGGAQPYVVENEGPDRLLELLKKGGDAWAAMWEQGMTVPPAMKERLAANDFQALIAARKKRADWERIDFTETLPATSVPCLIYAGEEDGGAYLGGKQCANEMPNATFVSLPGGTHFIFAQADLVLPHITQFLKAVNQ